MIWADMSHLQSYFFYLNFFVALVSLIHFKPCWLASSAHLVWDSFFHCSLKDPLKLGQIGCGLTVSCELQVSPQIFHSNFPGFGWPNEGHSETCPEATCFGLCPLGACHLEM